MSKSWRFLTAGQVIEIHAGQIADYGGEPGFLNENLLYSALAQPQHLYLYMPSSSVFDIAAAYAFHVTKNHAFCDGNKRTGAACAIAFLGLNGWRVNAEFTEQMIAVASGKMEKPELAAALESRGRKTFRRRIEDWFC